VPLVVLPEPLLFKVEAMLVLYALLEGVQLDDNVFQVLVLLSQHLIFTFDDMKELFYDLSGFNDIPENKTFLTFLDECFDHSLFNDLVHFLGLQLSDGHLGLFSLSHELNFGLSEGCLYDFSFKQLDALHVRNFSCELLL